MDRCDITPAEYEQIYNDRKSRQEREDREYRAFLDSPTEKLLVKEMEKQTDYLIQAITKCK